MRNVSSSRRSASGNLIVAFFFLLGFARYAAASEPPLTFGIFPYRTPQWLMTTYAPLRDYLQQTSERRVDMVSAPDYRTYHERVRAGDYDILFTAPHLARLAEKESRYQRIAMTRYQIQGVIVVPRTASAQRVTDLRGKTLAVPDPSALTYMLTMELLRKHGLEPGRDVALRVLDHNQNSMAAPLRGDADAAVTGILLWSKEGPHDKMRVLAETRAVPGFMLMAHPRVSLSMLARLRHEAGEFAGTPGGRAYFASTGHGAWLPIDDNTMLGLDPILPRLND